jgi:hypothetical protein
VGRVPSAPGLQFAIGLLFIATGALVLRIAVVGWEPKPRVVPVKSEARRILAHALFEFLYRLGVSRTIAFDLAFRWFAR